MSKHTKGPGKAKSPAPSLPAAGRGTSYQAGKADVDGSSGRLTIGLDLGDRSTAYCMLDADGHIVAEGKFKTSKAAIDQKLGCLAPGTRCVGSGHALRLDQPFDRIARS